MALQHGCSRRRPGQPPSPGLGDPWSNAHGRGAVLRCDAGVAADSSGPAATQPTAPCCGLLSGASEPPTPSSVHAVRSGSSCLAQKLGDAGTMRHSGSLETWRASPPSAWTRRWAALAVAVQHTVTSTAFGSPPCISIEGSWNKRACVHTDANNATITFSGARKDSRADA